MLSRFSLEFKDFKVSFEGPGGILLRLALVALLAACLWGSYSLLVV